MVRVIDNLGIIFLFFLSLLVGAGIFFGTEDDGVFIEPSELMRRANQVG